MDRETKLEESQRKQAYDKRSSESIQKSNLFQLVSLCCAFYISNNSYS